MELNAATQDSNQYSSLNDELEKGSNHTWEH